MFWRRYSLGWDPFRELRRLQHEMSHALDGFNPQDDAEFPPVNIWTGPESYRVTAELPGIDAKDLEISVLRDTLTLKGNRNADEIGADEIYHRQERGSGTFVRTFKLPTEVDATKVSARYQDGILEIELGRAEETKARRIPLQSV